MKKVLHIITKLELGGAQKSTLDILRNLDRAKYRIFLVSSDGLLADDAGKINGLEVRLLSSLIRQINPIFDLKALIDLYRFIKENEIDIVHTHGSKAGIIGRWAAYFAGVPIILHTIHGWEFHERQNRLIKWLFIGLERLTAKITTKLIAVCHADIEKGLNYNIGARDKYRLVYYGIDYEAFKDVSLNSMIKRNSLGLKEDALIIGMIACFKPQKAHADFIKAASLIIKEIPNVKFLLVGDGVLRPKIVRQIRSLGLRDRFVLTGWRRDIPQILPVLDMIVLSSHWEGLPIVLLESMAAGLPVVATNVGGVSEIIQDGNTGFLVPVGDYSKLAERILFLAHNSSLCEEMSKCAKGLLDGRFNTSSMVNQIEETYVHLLNKKQ